MIKLNFVIDDQHLVYHTIARRMRDTTGVANVLEFRERAKAKDAAARQLLCGELSQDWFLTDKPGLAQLALRAEELLKAMANDPLFDLVRRETQAALERVRDEWEADCDLSHRIMAKITGLSLDREILVYITHPGLTNGQNFNRTVFWTYWDAWPHCNTVYLWHEALHGFMDEDRTSHAVIELATDNELRFQLNGDTYPPFNGHEFLLEEKSRLLDDWRKYLKEGKGNIRNFVEMVRR
jgi:hypothetical protein